MIALLAGCGGQSQPVAKRDACGARVGKVKGPATQLTFRGDDDVVADVAALCERLRTLKVARELEGVGRNHLVVTVPSTAARGAMSVARTGRLAFYDWEANVIGPGGKPEPTDPKVTGGARAGFSGSLEYYAAVERASKLPGTVEADNARKGSAFYAVDPGARKVYGSGAATRAAALAVVPKAERAQAKVREVKPGTVVLSAEELPGAAPSFFVLKDVAALRGSDIVNPRQRLDTGPGATGAPIVTFDFTAGGAKAFATFTRTIARRGARNAGSAPGTSSADANQHFAIVLDDDIVSIPYIDFRANPDGIDGSTGSLIQGGFTILSARQLASILRSGELAVPLELVETKRSG
ncbi:MAG: SecD/SecF fusion protein [bacterium]